MHPGRPVLAIVVLLVLLGGAVGLQAVRERRPDLTPPQVSQSSLLYIRSGSVLQRAALSYDGLVADLYWIRALQHFGRTKLSTREGKQYDRLYPLLDLTTTLDPRFDIAYRFGAVFLAEAYPGGAGRPDDAIALLRKGLAQQPAKWQFAQDIGFVHYWWKHDYTEAAAWFRKAGQMPGAPNWLEPLAAVTLARGGNRASSRRLWQEVLATARVDAEWLRPQAEFRLAQLDAMDQIAAIERVIAAYRARVGDQPSTWADLIRTGFLRGVPRDPSGTPYAMNPYWGTVTLQPDSPLAPLPVEQAP